MNATAVKFGYPSQVVREYGHWLVLLRPWQVTFGSLVLVCKDDVKSFGDISQEAASELKPVVADVERALKAVLNYEKINYLMLMMVDPDVHMHVIPRHSTPRTFGGLEFVDKNWPKPPDVYFALEVPEAIRAKLLAALKAEIG